MKIKNILILSAIGVIIYFIIKNQRNSNTRNTSETVDTDYTDYTDYVVKEIKDDDILGQKYLLKEEYKGEMTYPKNSVFRKKNENNKKEGGYLLEYNNQNIFDVIPTSLLIKQ